MHAVFWKINIIKKQLSKHDVKSQITFSLPPSLYISTPRQWCHHLLLIPLFLYLYFSSFCSPIISSATLETLLQRFSLSMVTMGLKALFVWCIIWLAFAQLSLGGRVRHYKFDVEYMIRKPDCLEHVVMGINGQFPGPTIRAEVGDILDIALTNKLFSEGTVVHWHGIRQALVLYFFFFFCFSL